MKTYVTVGPEVRRRTAAEPVQSGGLQYIVGGWILVGPVEEFLTDPGKEGDGVAVQHEADGARLGGMLHGVRGSSCPPCFRTLKALLLDVGEVALIGARGCLDHTKIHCRGLSFEGRELAQGHEKDTHGGQLCRPRARRP